MPKEAWKTYVKSLPPAQQTKMLLVAIERLMECEEVSYRKENKEEGSKECIYWDGSGEDIRKP